MWLQTVCSETLQTAHSTFHSIQPSLVVIDSLENRQEEMTHILKQMEAVHIYIYIYVSPCLYGGNDLSETKDEEVRFVLAETIWALSGQHVLRFRLNYWTP